MKEKFNIFDFELSEEDIQEIAKINKNKRYYIPDPQLVASYANMAPPIDEQKYEEVIKNE